MLIRNTLFEVLTPFGFCDFEGFNITQAKKTLTLLFDNGIELNCTLDHKVISPQGEITADTLSIGDEVIYNGKHAVLIKKILNDDESDVIDLINVNNEDHTYYTNGILSHNCLVLDETAFIENFDEFFASVYPTISAGKQTKVIMISTPNGLNHFYKIWKDSQEGRNNYCRIEAIWSDVPGRDQKWKEDTLKALNNDIEKFNQEFAGEFMGSSGTLIAGWKLKELVQGNIIQDKMNIKQYYAPEENHVYVMIVDVSRGKGLDYSAFSIIDITQMPYQQVCTYRSNLTTPLDYANIIHNMAKVYHNAYVLVEINDIGEQVSTAVLFDFEYENIIYTVNNGRGGKTVSSGFGGQTSQDRGIRTTKQVKSVGCSILKLLIEQNQLIINDFDSIFELSRFSRKNASYEAESGCTDDLVMGLVLFGWLSDQSYFRELCDINTLMKLRDQTDDQLSEHMLPFGFCSEYENLSGEEQGRRLAVEGEWQTYEMMRDLYSF